ncbi:MAG: polysaccharide pyruvyl transferase family protein [Actinomycetota bacterium]|nr:polysaccharide pyruvyl transferase family protein [Actinomycetota bacterium]
MLSMDNATAWIVEGISQISALPKYKTWKPGEKLKILLVGYNGKRNTGADVRVAEMVKQFYRVLGKDHVEIGVITLDEELTKVYFNPPTKQIEISSIYFKDTLDACCDYHMAVLCEGSTLKSKFANALTFFFCEAAGIMKKQGKPSIAYGSEAGEMDEFVQKAAQKLCSETYFISRTQASLDIIKRMGLKGHLGTDTAWTFPPADRAWAEKELREKTGWDGKKPIVGAAVINPFYWPVKPSLVKVAKSALRRNWEMHYDKWYFFSWSPEREKLYKAYIEGIANALNEFSRKHNAHVIAIGMEALDYDAIGDFTKLIEGPTGFFSSRFYDGFQMTAILHMLSVLVTSRYHARVLSSSAGVPAIAVSMDERLYNVFNEAGHLEDYYISTDEPQLGDKLTDRIEKCWENREKVSKEVLETVPGYFRKMSEMGSFFREWVIKSFPGIELGPEPSDWLGYLPELSDDMIKIVETYEKQHD